VRRLEREVVVDSSVLVKFFVEEPDSGKADALFRHCEAGFIRFVCPDLVFPECVNVLWKKVQGSELSEPEAEERISKLLALSPDTAENAAIERIFPGPFTRPSPRASPVRFSSSLRSPRVGGRPLTSIFGIVPVERLLPDAFRIACEVGHPVYDAVFLALAERRQAHLVTADAKFYRKIKPKHPRILLLSELRP
jgi:predicted nucleic acid-binding protein